MRQFIFLPRLSVISLDGTNASTGLRQSSVPRSGNSFAMPQRIIAKQVDKILSRKLRYVNFALKEASFEDHVDTNLFDRRINMQH